MICGFGSLLEIPRLGAGQRFRLDNSWAQSCANEGNHDPELVWRCLKRMSRGSIGQAIF
jgi:hypothetical protein